MCQFINMKIMWSTFHVNSSIIYIFLLRSINIFSFLRITKHCSKLPTNDHRLSTGQEELKKPRKYCSIAVAKFATLVSLSSGSTNICIYDARSTASRSAVGALSSSRCGTWNSVMVLRHTGHVPADCWDDCCVWSHLLKHGSQNRWLQTVTWGWPMTPKQILQTCNSSWESATSALWASMLLVTDVGLVLHLGKSLARSGYFWKLGMLSK